MKNIAGNFFSSLSLGARLLLLSYALGFPLSLLGHYTHTFELYDWLALTPPLIWKGQIWRVATYAFLPGGIIDWVVSLFWLVTLVCVLGKHWSGSRLWGFGMLCVLAGAVPVVLFKARVECIVAGNSAMIFGFLAAWFRLYGRERLILLGIGEISVRQAAILVAIIDAAILLFSCGGWFFMVSMMGGGVAGWFYLSLRTKLMGKTIQPSNSERIVRLEL